MDGASPPILWSGALCNTSPKGQASMWVLNNGSKPKKNVDICLSKTTSTYLTFEVEVMSLYTILPRPQSV